MQIVFFSSTVHANQNKCVYVIFCFSNFAANASHIDRVCTTWGHYHFKTFDGDFFQLPSTCNHVLVSQCKSNYENFIIHMRRSIINSIPTISAITIRLEGSVVELSNNSVIVNGKTWVQSRPVNYAYMYLWDTETQNIKDYVVQISAHVVSEM